MPLSCHRTHLLLPHHILLHYCHNDYITCISVLYRWRSHYITYSILTYAEYSLMILHTITNTFLHDTIFIFCCAGGCLITIPTDTEIPFFRSVLVMSSCISITASLHTKLHYCHHDYITCISVVYRWRSHYITYSILTYAEYSLRYYSP